MHALIRTALALSFTAGANLNPSLSAEHPTAPVVTRPDSSGGSGGAPGSSGPEHGKYLVAIGGCNDCHTPGWDESKGKLATDDWLLGSTMGYRGPWGTTYAHNLRLSVQEREETAWVAMVRSRDGLPPMPWVSVHAMTEADTRDVYRFIKSLGPKGQRVPKSLTPDQEPTTPYVVLAPVAPKR